MACIPNLTEIGLAVFKKKSSMLKVYGRRTKQVAGITFPLVVLVVLVTICHGYECDKTASVCETTLVIQHKLTMMHPSDKQVYPYDGKIYKYDVDDPSQATPVPTEEVITADGWQENRLVIVANGTLPGPTITVYEGQRLIVHVINTMASDTLTIHFHGPHIRGSPWMDGTPFVTQCPILAGQSFTYDFIAEPKGTHWYHSHVGNQRSKGLAGALIVKERTSTMMEHVMTVQDWNHEWDSDMDHQKLPFDQFVNRIPEPFRNSLDGSLFLQFHVTSLLINGRGRYYSNVAIGQNNGAPVSVFSVDTGVTYRFRVIHVGALYPIRISIDSHELALIASDGFDIQPIASESFIINPGERYDFTITADQAIGNYWVRAETIEVNAHKSEAILRYSGALNQNPTTSRNVCISSARCLVVNCPFATYPADTYTDCLRFDQIRSAANDDPAPIPTSAETFKEHHMNFAFPRGVVSVNGREFKDYAVSALTQPYELDSRCNKEECGEEKTCRCTYTISLSHNNVIQLVLTNMGEGGLAAHPIHLHGYSFYVLKTGYATYNMTTGEFITANDDIDCRGTGDMRTSMCNEATWRNSSWLNNNVPGLELANPPRKDTLIIPRGEYAVIRFKADNPGVWMLHCHIQIHNSLGMRMLFNESYDMHPSPPKGFPVCHDFPSPYRSRLEDHMEVTPIPVVRTVTKIQDDGYDMKTLWVVFAVLVLIILFLLACNWHTRTELKQCKKQLDSAQTPDNTKANDNRAFSKI